MATGEPLAVEITGQGPAVLLIHAGIADRTMWRPQWERWADRFTLIRYDVRGFGESADPAAGGWSFHDDALAAIRGAGHESAAVLGCSMGSEIAFDLAVEHPDAVGALVSISGGPTPAGPDPELKARFEAIDEVLESDGIEAASQSWSSSSGWTVTAVPAAAIRRSAPKSARSMPLSSSTNAAWSSRRPSPSRLLANASTRSPDRSSPLSARTTTPRYSLAAASSRLRTLSSR